MSITSGDPESQPGIWTSIKPYLAEVHMISVDTADSPDRIMASHYRELLPIDEQMDVGYFHETALRIVVIKIMWELIRHSKR